MKIMRWNNSADRSALTGWLSKRRRPDRAVAERVRGIIGAVERRGDAALVEFCRRFDGVRIKPPQFLVRPSEIAAARRQAGAVIMADLAAAGRNIVRYHTRQRRQSWKMRTAGGGELGMRFQPLDRVGVYVPGGRAVYPSSALMNILPARVAGVREVVVCTPSRPDGTVHPFILAACDMAGADRIYRLGGAQAIAALALGTATIPAVDLIAGPGGAYVAEAKRQVYGRVGIDSIAGPTEIVIIADRTADPALVAADLFAQAEHDEQAAPILVTTDLKLAVRVRSHLRWFLAQLGDYRNGIPVRSLYRNGRFVIARDIDQALMIADLIAPEHLEILAAGADKIASRAKNAGAIFIGPDSPVAAGDYYCGTNHVLPTGGSARFASALGVDDFTRRVQVIKNTARDLSLSSSPVMRLAEAEGLLGHGLSIRARRK